MTDVVQVTRRERAAARLRRELDKIDRRETDPRIEAIANATVRRQAVNRSANVGEPVVVAGSIQSDAIYTADGQVVRFTPLELQVLQEIRSAGAGFVFAGEIATKLGEDRVAVSEAVRKIRDLDPATFESSGEPLADDDPDCGAGAASPET
jgi:hypothetical protein